MIEDIIAPVPAAHAAAGIVLRNSRLFFDFIAGPFAYLSLDGLHPRTKPKSRRPLALSTHY
jgi:hypothetical protein